ncbi:hypothetical protein GGR56DRAFT_689630 [Xylariaceae sp. FL0804]|nr:hypothetical protein GGR56DRAFT_689630 [Xylariaceae sp. FL0804]
MAELYLLPSSTYQPPSPSQGRRIGGTSLNTIMEEGSGKTQQRRPLPAEATHLAPPREKIVQWLSPQSDRFPTPRGVHYMSAPVLPPLSATSSSPWIRDSVSTDVTEFDDIYDVSDDEDTKRKPARALSLKRRNSSRVAMPERALASPTTPRALPRLVIPEQRDGETRSRSGRPDIKKLSSPMPPTPPAKVDMSPAVLSFMQSQHAQEVPTISAPPSLDGSLSSEQLTAMSAPPTPVSGAAEDGPASAQWSGVQLQPAALATLNALSGSEDSADEYRPEQVIEVHERVPEMSHNAHSLFTAVPRPVLRLSTGQSHTLQGLTDLGIPSPGGFFSGLSPRTRRTWHLATMTPDDVAPPTSTTAEQFYRLPWNESAPPVPSMSMLPPPPARVDVSARAQPVEQVVEVRDSMSDSIPTARGITEQIVQVRQSEADDLPTARRVGPRYPLQSPLEPPSPKEELVATEIVADYDPEYATKQQQVALSNLDRTELWLQAQKAYLTGISLEEEAESESQPEPEPVSVEPQPPAPEAGSPSQRKKTVRFSEAVIQADVPRRLPSRLVRPESAYYRAFQDRVIRGRGQDSFVHGLPRFEALQAQRVSLREAHRDRLLGKYQLSVVPQSARKRMSANVVRGDDELVDDPARLRREKELEAHDQMAAAHWHVGAARALHGGRLFSAPVAQRLLLPRTSSAAPGAPPRRPRVLDLAGQAACDWAWHCALAYPSAKVYTVTTKAARQRANSNVRGPRNHRQVAVDRLARLPFPDAHFDLVSARELHAALKLRGGAGEDEWASCLAEAFRVLRPGGYLDFSVMDADLVNAGPRGLAKGVEFGFALRTLGYDPCPTRLFLGRLARAGFDGVRRAWTCLPMGAPAPASAVASLATADAAAPPTPPPKDGAELANKGKETPAAEGSTAAAACVAGLAGGWAWERWLLRCEMEKVAGEGRLVLDPADVREAGKCLDGVHDVVEEGRRCGAGWRVLTGFARKPLA